MRRLATLMLAFGLAAMLVGACSADEDQTYQLPVAAISLPLPVQAASTAACPQGDLATVQVRWDAAHRVLTLGGEKFAFPGGFTSRELPTGRLEILAPDGTVVARDGDNVTFGGADYQHICRVNGVQY